MSVLSSSMVSNDICFVLVVKIWLAAHVQAYLFVHFETQGSYLLSLKAHLGK